MRIAEICFTCRLTWVNVDIRSIILPCVRQSLFFWPVVWLPRQGVVFCRICCQPIDIRYNTGMESNYSGPYEAALGMNGRPIRALTIS